MSDLQNANQLFGMVERRHVLLCADSESLAHPVMLGLEDFDPNRAGWIRTATTSAEAITVLKEDPLIYESWVFGSDDREALELAGLLKKAASSRRVVLVSFTGNGSVPLSCAMVNVTPCLGKRAFYELLRMEECRHPLMQASETMTAEPDTEVCQPEAYVDKEATVAFEIVKDKKGQRGKNSLLHGKHVRSDQELARRLPSSRNAHLATEKQQPGAFILSVVSGSGGTGKSTVAAVAALLLAQAGLSTLLVDCDSQFGDIDYLIGTKSVLDSASLLSHPERLSELTAPNGRPAVLAAPKSLELSERVADSTKNLISLLSDRFEVIIVNTGSFWMDQHLDLLELSSRVLFLVDQRPSSVRSCAHALDLCVRCGLPMRQFVFALNRCKKQALLTSLDVSCSLKGAKVYELKDGGPEVSELFGIEQFEGLILAKNGLCESVRSLLGELLPQISLEETKHKTTKRPKAKRKFGFAKGRVACL